MLDPKRSLPEETNEEVPAPLPDMIVQCCACLGGGIVEVHAEERRTCRGCFGTGSLSLPHDPEPTEDSAWAAALELLETFGIEKDPEAYAYQHRGDEWIVVGLETSRNGAQQ